MTSELSQMLDELMGKNRNAAPDDKSHDVHWSDKDVCKHFLCGFCPAELFTNTRSDLGPCQKIHDEALKKSYQQSTRYMKMSYEEEFLHYLTQCMTDVERRIRRNHQRLQLNEEKNQKPAITPNKDVEEQINLLTQRIEELLKKIEELGNEGNIEEAQGVMKLCDQLKEDRENLYNQQKGTVLDQFSVQEKQMEVCEVCGAFLIVGDAQSRVDDHLMGKQHMGYAKIKAHIEELKDQLRKKAEAPPEEEKKKQESRDRDRRTDDRQRRRDGDRDKDRDRDRQHSRDYESRRSRDDRRDSRRHDDRRDSGRHRSRERERDRDRDRGYHSRSRDDRERRSSHRSRSRDRDRDRDRRHSHKHSRPRSRSRDRKESKRPRRSRSADRKRKEHEGENKESVKESGGAKQDEGIVSNTTEEQNQKTGEEDKVDGREGGDIPENGNQQNDNGTVEQGKATAQTEYGETQSTNTEGDQ